MEGFLLQDVCCLSLVMLIVVEVLVVVMLVIDSYPSDD